MLRIVIYLAWAMFAADLAGVIIALTSRGYTDAAGRGLWTGFGMIALPIVLGSGIALYYAARAQSWVGTMAAIVPLSLPLLFVFGGDIEDSIHHLTSAFRVPPEGRFSDPTERRLAQAIAAGDLAEMKKILGTHPNLKGVDAAGSDLVSYAIANHNAAAVELLFNAGMDADKNADGESRIVNLSYWFDQPGRKEIFRLCLEHGANPNVSRQGQPLVILLPDHTDVLKVLLDHGADVNTRYIDGTPLLVYLQNGQWDAALVVLEHGADKKAVSDAGMTAIEALNRGRAVAERDNKPLPESYTKLAAALAQ